MMVALVVLGGAAVAFVVSGVVYVHGRGRVLRRLRAHALVPIASASEGGITKIAGTLCYGSDTVSSPISGRECAVYRLVIEEQHRGGDWATVVVDVGATDFLVDDGSGRALIRVSGASVELAIVNDEHLHERESDKRSHEIEAVLARHGKSPGDSWPFTQMARTKEGALTDGARVVVLGVAHWEPEPDATATAGNYREKARRLVVTAMPGQPLLITDDPAARERP